MPPELEIYRLKFSIAIIKLFPAQNIGLWLADLFGLPIRGQFFWRETTWTHVLTWISEKSNFSAIVYQSVESQS